VSTAGPLRIAPTPAAIPRGMSVDHAADPSVPWEWDSDVGCPAAFIGVMGLEGQRPWQHRYSETAVAITLGSVLGTAGVAKFIYPFQMCEAFGQLFPSIPFWTRFKCVHALSSFELCIALGLCWSPLRKQAATLCLLLFSVFTVANAYVLIGRIDIDCGCFGAIRVLNEPWVRCVVSIAGLLCAVGLAITRNHHSLGQQGGGPG
jgi:uncharacterized membrane protein